MACRPFGCRVCRSFEGLKWDEGLPLRSLRLQGFRVSYPVEGVLLLSMFGVGLPLFVGFGLRREPIWWLVFVAAQRVHD